MSDQNSPIGFNRPKAHATPLSVFSDRKAMGDRCNAKSGMGINRLTLFCDDDWNRHGGAIASLVNFA
jgi:hypothetical protein